MSDELRPSKRSNNTGAVDKTLEVLEMIILDTPSPTAAQISDNLRQPRSTTNRLIANLIRLGFVRRDSERRQLMVGERLFRLSLGAMGNAAQHGPCRQILQDLAAETEETCNLGIITQGRVRYIDRVEAKWPLALRLEPGSEIPLYCTALGKLLVGLMPGDLREKHLSTATLHRYTANTIMDVETLRRELDLIAEERVSFDREEYLSGVIGMAVPIPTRKKVSLLGLAVAAPSARVDINTLKKDLPALHDAAAKLAVYFEPD